MQKVAMMDVRTATNQLFFPKVRNKNRRNKKVSIVNPALFKRRENPTSEPKVRRRGTQGMLSFSAFWAAPFFSKTPAKTTREKIPKLKAKRKGRNPGPGLAKLPNPKFRLFQLTWKESKIKNKEEKKSFLSTYYPLKTALQFMKYG